MKPSSRAADGRDPALGEALTRHRAAWVPMFLGRAALGIASVVTATDEPAGTGSVVLLSPTEASALLKQRGDARGAARVVGTPSPGTTWALGLTASGTAVWSLPMGAFLAG